MTLRWREIPPTELEQPHVCSQHGTHTRFWALHDDGVPLLAVPLEAAVHIEGNTITGGSIEVASDEPPSSGAEPNVIARPEEA
jgi:hypothetical protein